MKFLSIIILLTGCFLGSLPLAAKTNNLVLFPEEDPLTSEEFHMVWNVTPGVLYEIQQSSNLQSWKVVSGFPATATSIVQQLPFLAAESARFFRLVELDTQPPAIVSQYPRDRGFAVSRFANLTVQLSDVTGIDTDSIKLTVGSLGTFTSTNSQLTFSNGFVTYVNDGSIPLGGWGGNVQATLIAADALGNTGTNIWNFTLELLPQVVSNLFVFGSPLAQRIGQLVGNIPTAALVGGLGPIRASDGKPWMLESVETDRLVLSYIKTAPAFSTNLYICNLTPSRPSDIFNRKITRIADDTVNKRLTLFTLEVPLTELVASGSVTISSETRLLETSGNGMFAQSISVFGTIPFPRIGYSLDGASFKLNNRIQLILEQQHWWLIPKLQASMEITSGSMQRFEATATGSVESASIWNVEFLLAGIVAEATLFDLPEQLEPKKWMFLGNVGPVPVFASFGFDIKLEAEAKVVGGLSFRTGKREIADIAFGIVYDKPDVRWIHASHSPPPEQIPLSDSINITSEGSLRVSMNPALEFLIYGLAGVSAGFETSGGVVFKMGDKSQCISGSFESDFSLTLQSAGAAFESLNSLPESRLPILSDEWSLFGCTNLAIIREPASQIVSPQSSVHLYCAVQSSEPPFYQWYFNNTPLVGQTAHSLFIPNVTSAHVGEYQVRVTAGNLTTSSAIASLGVLSAPGMVIIPEGIFQMGDALEDNISEKPVHPIYLSAFLIDKFEVTASLWEEVRFWGLTNGYTDLPFAHSRGANHPVLCSWYDAVKWCNARSEMEGRVPVYYIDAADIKVYRTGETLLGNYSMNWNGNGYRLPTEAEWEKAARGGLNGRRFPRGNTISHDQANYFGSDFRPDQDYDLSAGGGYHPTFSTDGTLFYTSPVGYFRPNGYSLYDMDGNVSEWCWDSWARNYYSHSPARDPRGPDDHNGRIYRGGGWSDNGVSARCSYRSYTTPSLTAGIGFRTVTQGQSTP